MRRAVRTIIELCLVGLLALAPAAAWAQVPPPVPQLQPVLLDIEVNGQRGTEPALLLRDADGALYAGAALLRQWRLRAPAISPVRFQGEDYYRIADVPGLGLALVEETQTLRIDAAPDRFEMNRAAWAQSGPPDMTPSAAGAFVNYDLFGEVFRGRGSIAGAFEAGIFTRHGVGVTSFTGRAGTGEDRLVRLETNWTIDRPASMTSLRIGDAVTVAGPSASPVRFGGVQFGRNFAVQPGYVTMPLPSIQGSAALPSVVDVYVNNVLQGSRELGPGPFELTHLPIQSGGGQVQLVVRDLLGRQLVTEHSYYASSRLLRRGLHDFSYEIGMLREGFGRRSFDYGALMASTTHRYGLTDRLTAEMHVQATERTQMASAGAIFSLFDLGLVSGSAAVSRSEGRSGTQFAASYERRGGRFSFGAQGDYSSAGFAFVGMPDGFKPPRLSVNAFADARVGGATVGANIIHRDHRDRPDETIAGLFTNFRIGDRASINLYARRAVGGTRETVGGAHLSFALGGRRSAAASAELRRRGSTARVTFQEDPPIDQGFGYRVAGSVGASETLDAAVAYNARFAAFTAQAAYADGGAGVRVTAAGSFGLVSGRAFAARSLGQSFAAVKVGEQEGVRVYADNRLVGRTGPDGMLIVPGLRAFDRNMIRIDETDLPIEVQLASAEIPVRPYARSAALVSFDLHVERGVLMQVRLEDGSPLPAGARLVADRLGGEWVAVNGGEVYVPDLSGTARFTASWSGRSCDFTATVPAGSDPQPRIAGLVCRSSSYAQR